MKNEVACRLPPEILLSRCFEKKDEDEYGEPPGGRPGVLSKFWEDEDMVVGLKGGPLEGI